MLYGDIYYIVIGLAIGGLCFWMADFAEENRNSKFKLIYVLPALASVVAMVATKPDICLIAAYVGTILVSIGFFVEKKKIRQIVSVISILACIISVVVCMNSDSYRAPDYLEEFEQGFETMKEHYVLTEQKGIDWDELYQEYRPQFVEINKNHDKYQNYITWQYFCDEFQDGHVGYGMNLTDAEKEIIVEKMYGHDFGFSMVRTEAGTIAAVNVGEGTKAQESGLQNGSIITKWNGAPIDEMLADFHVPLLDGNMPVKENRDFLSVIHAAGNSEDTLILTFLDADSKEKEVTLPSLGAYYRRLEDTITTLMNGTFETNLTVRSLNETTAFIRVSQMAYDTESYGSNNYDKMIEELEPQLITQKEQGVENLILDLRANGGGDPNFSKAILQYLLPEGEYTLFYNGVWDYEKNEYARDDNGKYVLGETNTITCNGLWGDGKIVVLVSATTVSAGDMFTELASRFDNITIMGITTSNCSSQAVRGVSFEQGSFTFSSVPALKEDGSTYIDPSQDGEATIELDEKIAFDDAFIDAVFNNGEDYILDKAIEYCEQ